MEDEARSRNYYYKLWLRHERRRRLDILVVVCSWEGARESRVELSKRTPACTAGTQQLYLSNLRFGFTPKSSLRSSGCACRAQHRTKQQCHKSSERSAAAAADDNAKHEIIASGASKLWSSEALKLWSSEARLERESHDRSAILKHAYWARGASAHLLEDGLKPTLDRAVHAHRRVLLLQLDAAGAAPHKHIQVNAERSTLNARRRMSRGARIRAANESTNWEHCAHESAGKKRDWSSAAEHFFFEIFS